MIWDLLAGIVAAVITSIGGNSRSVRRFIENWSPATRHRELRLLHSHESKAEGMNSASCDIAKKGFRSFVRDYDCEIERFEFARELKNPRMNLKLAEESASLPGVLITEFVFTWTFLVLLLDGLLVLPGLLRQWSFVSFGLAVLILSGLLFVVWALLTQASKQYYFNEAIKDCFNNFLMPVFQESEVCCDKEDEFKKAIRSFHNVYGDSTILSLKKALRRLLVVASILLLLSSFIDTIMSNCFQWNWFLRFRPTSWVVMTLVVAVLLCCLLTFYSKLQELIQEEKEKYPWYNPLIDADHVRHCKILDKTCEFGYWLGETIGKPKKR